jgi:nitroimidazol reductase NimA-like FMN-containing flavoprotein (pyridoxamine 5'-phosphate oxidase superfamily)
MENTINKVLGDQDIDKLLQQQYIGRLACQEDGHLYVLPISYAYKIIVFTCTLLKAKKSV